MPVSHQQQDLDEACRILKRGGVIAYPTESVWGLGCLPNSRTAIRNILALKQRSATKGMILVSATIEQVLPYIRPLSNAEIETLGVYWPGPITSLVTKSAMTSDLVSGDSTKVAIRVSAHPVIIALCNKINMPLISTSANPTGKPPAKTASILQAYFPNGIDQIFPGELGGANGVSEIRDFESGRIIRRSVK